ncbi:MAG: hypothetical protein COZ46_02620 [Verrucomicrobia bacterium CG_4_10_14_3_um_filter_43_23]|nr:MAG: hypothetical protein AUJ82_06155 [Verrucomicrobia bacterium CG1_02_43_26]PIP60078.1 MAG: hypothetical protein COX01_00530 [Verrucomicrobia bacterium CG22_combo_CG10-13_8_21_14_all_43_17]PIX58675.1 MAG: hypothetical protein COZ46_02620 [Verrucomicrobia bacterium CG_4_10_14_3_um_filter_43_23]PIY62624.1 MAG: hypothetical protein COY94_01405 [Verrucomicrobia bacterium CG_4_10_14_0_8_um_filter_43_34]PJA43303.1 MAG: hypothetical protein CO175_08775 [Verrucomicrobia bacterium CG_4_9_14_3_um_fi
MLDYRIENETLTISIPGDISSTNASEVQASIIQIVETKNVWQNKWNHLKIDLTRAEIIDSLGINVLINVQRKVKNRPCDIEIVIASSTILQLLSYTRIDQQMKITMLDASDERSQYSS